MLNHFKTESIQAASSNQRLTSKISASGNSHGQEKVPIYYSDGKGRDSYIIGDGGGFIKKYWPYEFCTSLRSYDVVPRRGFGVKKTSSDYQNWLTNESARDFNQRRASVLVVTKKLAALSNFESWNSGKT